MSDAVRFLGRAYALAKAIPVSDRTDAVVASLALVIEEIIRTSPDDQATQVAIIARTMRRETN